MNKEEEVMKARLNKKAQVADDSSDLENFKPKKTMGNKVNFLPSTFEGMMEQFGINLQRKTLYENFFRKHQEIETNVKRKEIPQDDIVKSAKDCCDLMQNIMKTSIAMPSSLKNEHNTLFLSLMDRITYLKKLEEEKQVREKSRSRNDSKES